MSPEVMQSMMQMATMQGMMAPGTGGGGGGMSPEVMQSMMQMATLQGLPPAALQSMMASMAGGRGASVLALSVSNFPSSLLRECMYGQAHTQSLTRKYLGQPPVTLM